MLKSKPTLWKYEPKEVRDDVAMLLPKDRALRVYLVTSGDSGKKYWVQMLLDTSLHPSDRLKFAIVQCDCPEGRFKGNLLSIYGINEEACKHSKNLLEFLKQKGL